MTEIINKNKIFMFLNSINLESLHVTTKVPAASTLLLEHL